MSSAQIIGSPSALGPFPSLSLPGSPIPNIQTRGAYAPFASPAVDAAAPRGETATRAAIARAASDTGMDFDYLLGQAKLESSLDPNARARTSSASGLYQFIDNTWLETLDRHGERLGLGDIANAIETRGGRAHVSDPAQRDAILALRFDPQTASLMAGAFASDNHAHLQGVLGRDPQPAELYLAHFLGAGGAEKFLTALQTTPDRAAADVLPRAASTNRGIFYSGGAPRSVQGVMDLFERKMGAAMEGRAAPAARGAPASPIAAWAAAASHGSAEAVTHVSPSPAPLRRSPTLGRAALPSMPELPSLPPRQSMADILRGSFGAGDSGGSQDHVQRAYGKLKAMGL